MENKGRIIELIDELTKNAKELAFEIKKGQPKAKMATALSKGVIGELLVYKKLLEGGIEPEYYGGQKMGFDIKANGKTIDCKETTEDEWVRSDLKKYFDCSNAVDNGIQFRDKLKERDGLADFYVFVDLKNFFGTGNANFYVLSNKTLLENLRRNYFYENGSTRKRPKTPTTFDHHIKHEHIKDYEENNLESLIEKLRNKNNADNIGSPAK